MRRRWIWWIIAALFAVALIWAMAFALETFSMLDLGKLNTLSQSTVLLDNEGKEAAQLSGSVNRKVIALGEIPEDVQYAFVAAEDARFYRHFGVDLYRIGGALWSNVKTRDYGQGASTITQQLIKLTHLTSDKTLMRKAREALLAIRLEMIMDKPQILEAYLNTVYFGAGAYGIEAAAETYFGVPARRLTLSQGALLAAVIKSPSNYAPHLHFENAIRRRKLVLSEMVEQGYVTREQADAAGADVPEIMERKQDAQFAWYAEQAADEAVKILGIDREQLLGGGYKIYTALDAQMQRDAEALFSDPTLFPPEAGGVPVQAALVCAGAEDGEVMALIGGRDYAVERGLNRAGGILRQPGSAFKPISVYAEAIDRFGYLPVSFVDDTQRDFGGGYTPGNVNGRYYGEVTLREALSRSLNVATIDLLSKTSVQAAREYAEAAGIRLDPADNNLSMGLGALTQGVSPLQLSAAYAPLANGGRAVTPHLIRRVEDAAGVEVYSFYQPEKQVMSPVSARLITDMLITTAESGTARALNKLKFPVAGKTGTVGMAGGGNRDVWTVGYTPKATACVWMGFDQPSAERKLSDQVSGSAQPARLLATFLEAAGKRADGGPFPVPSGLVEVLIDKRALGERHRAMLVSELTPRSQISAELFPEPQVPRAVSDVWRAPSRVFDLKAARVEGGVRVSFTCVDDWAIYQLYRVRDGGAKLIAELSGAAGDVLAAIDFEDAIGDAGYYVLPLEKTLKAEGVELAGKPSPIARITPTLDWAEPEATPAPVPMEPMFG
ncbi:transglycosylase domain-containing protein [Bacillota bacterium Meth-B3]|nr:PBP1A family penicillin-binding protein [Christensenellaceae bacterium]MEA5069945.1 PBP1A family penicillin-binding protein [Christensenellaceae bacterium]